MPGKIGLRAIGNGRTWGCSATCGRHSNCRTELWQPAHDARAPGRRASCCPPSDSPADMRENGLQARQRRRFKRATDSEHSWPVAPNLLDQVFEAEAPGQKWGVDISYIWTRQGWLYLAIVLDLFSRRVVGWTTSDRLHRALALSALEQALIMRQPAAGPIHHSDRGSQYCAVDYQGELRKNGILISMSGKGNCYDNAMVETLFQDPEIRADLANKLPNQAGCRAGHCPLHRRLLQPRKATFRPRLPKPRSVRKPSRRQSELYRVQLINQSPLWSPEPDIGGCERVSLR